MKADIKANWVAALRSGEYRQARGQLISPDASGDRYCCLGVLCDLAVKDGVEGVKIIDSKVQVKPPEGSSSIYPDYYPVDDQVLPPAVAEWAGLRSYDPRVESIPLSLYNDGGSDEQDVRPHDFSEIADLIEKYL